MHRRVGVVCAVLLLAFSPTASASPALIQCPGSNAHVWDSDQCPRIGSPYGIAPGGGGTSGGGLIGTIRRLLGL